MKQAPDWHQLIIIIFIISISSIASCAGSLRSVADKHNRASITKIVAMANAITCAFVALILWAFLAIYMPERVDTIPEILLYAVLPATVISMAISGIGFSIRLGTRKLLGSDLILSFRRVDEGSQDRKDC